MPENAISSLTRQRRLLEIEYEAEKEAFARITGRIGLERLIARGNAWFPLSVGRSYYNSLNQRVVELTRAEAPDDAEADDHNFEYGKPIMVFTLDGDASAKPRRRFAATVAWVDGNRMVAVVPDNADLAALEGVPTGVMLSLDETTFRAMFEALDRMIAASSGRQAELRDLFYSRRPAAELTCRPMGFAYLNRVQEEAVNKVLRAKDVAVVHGPPGTGKTTTLVEAIHETLRRESQVLVCAQSNMAVDWISEKLVDRGINVLRLGNPSRVNDKMLSFTYERRFEAHPDYPTLWSIRQLMRQMHAHRSSTDRWHQKMDRLRSRATELELRINADIFGQARVIASTLVGSSSRLLDGMTFETLFVDEAAQALEAATYIAMRRARRLVLAGDHCQLPPMVRTQEGQKGGLSRSLMELIAGNHPEAVTLLTRQYRMNRDIMLFPSRWFYGSMMEAAPEVASRGILDFDIPVEWIDTDGISADVDAEAAESEGETPDFAEAVCSDSFGRVNRAEAELTLKLLADYLERIGRSRVLDERLDIGVISPYRAQVRCLRRMVGRSPELRPYRKLISVNTVDGFQGQERDIIMISLVRSNDSGQIGFLRENRRMNVAMTRARQKLIIVGSVATLTAHSPFYRRLHRYVAALGGAEQPPIDTNPNQQP